MKTLRLRIFIAAMPVIGLLTGFDDRAQAQESPPNSTTPAAPPGSSDNNDNIRLSQGAREILKLSKAKVNDNVTVAFIQSSGRQYSLSPSEIVYLHDQGVSDQVLAAMLSQPPPTPPARPQLAQAAPQASPAPAPAAPTAPPPVVAAQPQYAPSSAYVIPYTAAYDYGSWYYPSYSYSSWYPYYGYYSSYYPWFSFGIGLGSRCYYPGRYYGRYGWPYGRSWYGNHYYNGYGHRGYRPGGYYGPGRFGGGTWAYRGHPGGSWGGGRQFSGGWSGRSAPVTAHFSAPARPVFSSGGGFRGGHAGGRGGR